MNHPATSSEARISEIFSSLQGEGTHVGEKHLFIRFEECHMHCEYCDELGKPAISMSLAEVLERVDQLENESGPHQFISLTGGEPLLYLAFIKPLIAQLKERGHRIYLETSGVLHTALREIIDQCDCVAMDMKASSVTKEKNYDSEHALFLEIAREKETFVKIVVSKEISDHEFDQQIQIIEKQSKSIPLVLMPLSSDNDQGQKTLEGHDDPSLMTLIDKLQLNASKHLDDVRIVPRMHKILNIQ